MKDYKNVIELIHNNYNYLNEMMIKEMDMASDHDPLTGDNREQMWMKFFRSIIPKKFAIAQGVKIIDSVGNISREVDIAVYDEQYTPYVFQYNTLKFIPIEAVAVVIECKSTQVDSKVIDRLDKWVKSITDLKPKSSGIARMVDGYVCGITNKTQVKTTPIRIFVSLKTDKKDETIDAFADKLKDYFHFIIQEQESNEKNKKFVLSVPHKDKTLGWWAKVLNGKGNDGHLPIKFMVFQNEEEKAYFDELKFNEELHLENKLEDLEIEGNPFLTLNFQLNQLLMLLNNPMLFPHFAYAKRFREIISDLSEEKK